LLYFRPFTEGFKINPALTTSRVSCHFVVVSVWIASVSHQRCPTLAANVPAAWRSGGVPLHFPTSNRRENSNFFQTTAMPPSCETARYK